MNRGYGVLKDWSADFGHLKPHEASYFRRELRGIFTRPGCRILEIGFGNGSFMAYMRNNHYRVWGVELDETSLARATAAGYDVHRPSELEKLADGYPFYVVAAFDVLEHMTMDELHRLFRLLPKLLNEEGFFVARFPNGQSPFGLINQNGDITHKTAIGAEMIRQFAALYGLEVVAIRNPALWLHSNPLIASVRIAQAILAKVIEMVISAAFYSRIEPMRPNLVAVLRKKH